MEKIIGNLTADAKTETVNGKTVTNFSVAVNDSYKDKSGKRKTYTRYFNCAIWNRDTIATYLTKGKLVEVDGIINAQAYIRTEGNSQEAVAKLVMRVSNVKFHSGASKHEGPASIGTDDENEDFPF